MVVRGTSIVFRLSLICWVTNYPQALELKSILIFLVYLLHFVLTDMSHSLVYHVGLIRKSTITVDSSESHLSPITLESA